MSNLAKNENVSANKRTAASEGTTLNTDTKPETKAPAGDPANSPTAAPTSDSKH